jgi:hypothetical protein
MLQVCFEGVSQQKQHDFNQKSRFGNGMNLLGKSHRDMTKHLLNPLTNLLFVSRFPSRIGTLAIAFSLYFQANTFTLSIIILLLVISVASIAIDFTPHWQSQMHHLKSRHIHIRTRQNEKLNGLFVTSGDELDPEAKKEASFGRDFAPVLFPLHQPGAAYADVVTNRNRKRINQVFSTHIEGFEKVRQIVKQGTQGGGQPMKSPIKGRFFQHNNPFFIRHVQHSRGLVAAEETGRYDSGCQHDAVAHFRGCLGFYTALISAYFDEIIIRSGGPAKSNKLPLLSQT